MEQNLPLSRCCINLQVHQRYFEVKAAIFQYSYLYSSARSQIVRLDMQVAIGEGELGTSGKMRT
jgi:hypothetical protein